MKLRQIFGLGAVTLTIVACFTNPITGRKSLQIVGNNEIQAQSLQEYQKTLSQGKVITSKQSTQVKTVGLRIKNAAENYWKAIGREGDIANYQWEFNLLQDAQVNAWCMPGGKVAVYTGLLPVTQNDAGLAVVLGHEISHALAGHGNERISQAMLAQYGGAIVGGAISNQQLSGIFSQAYPLGAKVGLLAYGRKQETEADTMGLMIMSMAGYDPRQATPFWSRMEAMTASQQRPPDFLATHPNPGDRINNLNNQMSKALEYYKQAGGKL